MRSMIIFALVKMNIDYKKTAFDANYRQYVSGEKDAHASYNELFKNPVTIGNCPDLYKLGRIDTAPELRAVQGLGNQTVANVCICAVDSDVCSRKNLYPLSNASCSVPLTGDAAKNCQTSNFNTKV